MTDEQTFAPVERLDAPRLIDTINETYGLGLRYVGPATGGNVGAGYVLDPGGRRSVLTWQSGSSADRHRRIGELLELARAAGIPAPRYEHVLQVGGAVAVIQQLLPGTPPGTATDDLVTQLIALNDRQRGLLADRADLPPSPLYLTESGPGFCLHEPLAAYSERTRRLLGAIREVGAASPPVMGGDDLVHLDFQPANVLVEDGRITGIIDWDGAGRGDARFDLVVLYFGLHSFDAAERTIRALSATLHQELTDAEFRTYWACMSLRMIDWAIRHYSASDVDTWLDLAELEMG